MAISYQRKLGDGTIVIESSSSYVGIGTNDPVRPLHLHSASNTQMQFTDNGTGATDTDGLRVGWNGSVGQMWLFEDASLRFATNNSEKLRITSGGNVGIGTTSPLDTLHVDGTFRIGSGSLEDDIFNIHQDSSSGIITTYRNNTGGVINRIYADYGNDGTIVEYQERIGWNGNYSEIGNYSNHPLYIHTNNSTRMTISSSGMVGIGTTDPLYSLELRNAYSGNNVIMGYYDTSNAKKGFIGVIGTDGDFIDDGVVGDFFVRAQQKLHLSSGTAGDYQVTIDTDGSVQFSAYGAGYLKTDASGNITVDTDTIEDTLDTVTTRGNSTTNSIVVGGLGSSGEIALYSTGTANATNTEYDSNVLRFSTSGWDTNNSVARNVHWNIRSEASSNIYPDAYLTFYEESIGYNHWKLKLPGRGSGDSYIHPDAALFNGNVGIYELDTTTVGISLRPAGDSYFTNNLGIGVTSPSTLLTLSANLNNAVTFARDIDTIGALVHGVGTAGAEMWLHRDDVTIGDGNALGKLNFSGADGGSYVGASILGQASGNWSSTNSKSRLIFETTSDGATSPSEKMRIEDNGNVGIGTTTFPTTSIGTTEFLVEGAIISKPSGVDDYYSYLKSNWVDDGAFELGIQGGDTNHKLITSSNYYYGTQLNFHTSDTKRMVIDTNGNVGIGTTSPSSKLSVNGSAHVVDSFTVYTTDPASGGTSNGYIQIQGEGNQSGNIRNTYWRIQNTIDSQWGNGALVFYKNYDGAGFSEQMRIASSGNVGIGTTSPLTKLHVEGGVTINTGNGSSTFNDLNIGGVDGWSSSEAHRINFVYGNGTSDVFQTIESYYGGANEGKMRFRNFFTNSAQTGILMTIHNNGNVGIGTDSPDNKLMVQGASTDGASSTGNVALFEGPSGTNGLKIFVDDTENAAGLQTISADDLLLNPHGGNVGIGTTSPTNKLEVAGTILINHPNPALILKDSSDDDDHYIQFLNNADSVYYQIDTAGDTWNFNSLLARSIKFGTAGSDRMVITGSGDVGIGTASPNQKLHVEGAIYAGTANSTSGSLILVGKYSNGNIITIGGEYSNGGVVIGYGVKPSTTAAGAFLSSSSLTNLQRGAYSQVGSDHRWWAADYQTVAEGGAVTMSRTMTLRGNGNLGLGTTNPQTKLHVQEGIGIFNVSDDWHQSSSGTHLFRGGGFNSSISEESTAVKIFNGSGITGKAVGNYWGGIAFMHLDPEYSTWGSSYPGEHFWIGGRLIDTPGQERSALVFAINNLTTGGSHSSEKMVILPDGNVGIGTTNPLYKLTVDSGTDDIGIVTASSDSGSYVGFLDNATSTIPKVGAVGNKLILDASQYVGVRRTDPSYALDVSGTIRATGDVIAYSDARVKENVETIPNALDKVKSMRGVGYNKIGEEKRSVGVIAQELLEVLPEAVHQDEAGMYSVAYGNIVGVLVEAMKEQQKQIDELKAQLDGITE